MALERPDIEKKDFPVGRRGYDPAAVDAHLSTIADEVEGLTRSAGERTESLAATASEQVRAIVEAAEKTAADIEAAAEREAREIRGDASSDAKREREQASSAAQTEREEAAAAAASEREQAATQALEYVSNVSDSTSQMLKRLEAMEGELGALTEALRTGASRLTGELESLESEMKDLGASAATQQSGVGQRTSTSMRWPPTAAAETGTAPVDEEEAVEPVEEEYEPAGVPTDVAPAVEEPETSVAQAEDSDNTEGARLIALNMALNGTPREETDKYLAENFQLSDRGQLLDEVYASVEG